MTSAIPFGIYLVHSSILRAGVREQMNDWCYIQLQQRLDTQTYGIFVANDVDDLHALSSMNTHFYAVEERVLVSTLSRQDVHTQCYLVSAPCAEAPVYVAPDAILKYKQSCDGEDLQLFAASGWMCYFCVNETYEDGSVRVSVSALPERLRGKGRTYGTTLSREEFAQASLFDRRECALSTSDLLEIVEEGARRVTNQEIERSHPHVALIDEDEEESIDVEEHMAKVKGPEFEQLPTTFVPEHILASTAWQLEKQVKEVRLSSRLQQKLGLQAALNTLAFHREEMTSPEQIEVLQVQDKSPQCPCQSP